MLLFYSQFKTKRFKMDIDDIVQGYEEFRDKKFKKYKNRFSDLIKQGQNPKILFISCCDSRVVPNLLTSTDPGDMFIVRNIGNMVPPYSPDNDFHSTAAAIEYAVSILKVSEIIVCGHSHCGAISGLYKDMSDEKLVHVNKWLELGSRAKEYVLANMPNASMQKRLVETEKVSIIFQLINLLTYPQVEDKVSNGELNLRGWYYKIGSGELEYYDDDSFSFKPLDGNS